MWKQEPLGGHQADPEQDVPFLVAWRELQATPAARRLLLGVGLGAAGFGMQDVLLEPYGGEVMGLAVGATSLLTALTAGGAVLALAATANQRLRETDPNRMSVFGAIFGAFALVTITLAGPAQAPPLLHAGAVILGFGGGLFAVGTITACMELTEDGASGGLALAQPGALSLGPEIQGRAAGYAVVYQLEIVALFAAAVALGPLVQAGRARTTDSVRSFGLGTMPG